MTKEEFSTSMASAIAGCDGAVMDNRQFEWLMKFIDKVASENGDAIMLASVSLAQTELSLAMNSTSENNRQNHIDKIKGYCDSIGKSFTRIEKSKAV